MPKLKLAAGLAAAVGLLAVAPLAIARDHAAKATSVTVKASEFKFVLSRKSAPHGTVTFKVTNKGHINHDFKIAGKKTPLLKPGKSATLKVTLKKGRYGYLCTVKGHALAGMKGTFRAT
jgi:nitrite reductase (NO-forming)